MLIAWVSFLVCLVGLIMFGFSKNSKVADVGKIMFFCGLLVTLFVAGGKTIRIP